MNKDRNLQVLGAIKDISQRIGSRQKLSKLLKDISRISKESLGCDSCEIWLYDQTKNQLILKGASGRQKKFVNNHFYNPEEGLTWSIFNMQTPTLLKKASDSSKWKGKYVDIVYPTRVDGGGAFLGVPLLFQETTCYGVLAFESDDDDYTFDKDNQGFAEIIAVQISIVLNGVYANQEREKLDKLNKDRLKFISTFNLAILKLRSQEDILKFVCDQTRDKLICRTASIFLFNKDGQLERKYISGFKSKKALPIEILDRGQGYVGRSAGTPSNYGKTEICLDVEKDPFTQEDSKIRDYIDNFEKAVKKEYGIDEKVAQVVTIPLQSNRRTGGVLRIINKIDPETGMIAPKGISDEDVEWLEIIASLVANSIARNKTRIRKNGLNQINDLLSQPKHDKIFDAIAKIIVHESTSYSVCVIRQLDPQTQYLKIIGCSPEVKKGELDDIKVGEGTIGKILNSDSYKSFSDLVDGEFNKQHKTWMEKHGLVSMAIFPLKSIQKSFKFGTLSVYTKFPFIFDDNNIDYLQKFGNQISNVIQGLVKEKQFYLLNQLSGRIKDALDLNEIFSALVLEIPKFSGFDSCRFYLNSEDHFKLIHYNQDYLGTHSIPINGNQILKQAVDSQAITSDNFNEINKGKLKYFVDSTEAPQTLVIIPIKASDDSDKLYGFVLLVKKKSEYNPDSMSLYDEMGGDLFETLSNMLTSAITRYREIEEKRKILEKKENDSKLIRTLINTIPDLVYIKDIDGKFILVNKAQEDLLNSFRPKNPQSPLNLTDFDFFPKTTAGKFHYNEVPILNNEEPRINVEEEFVDGQGNKRIFLTTKAALLDKNNNRTGLVGIGRDINEIRENDKKLRNAKNELEKSVEIIKNFFAKFKHNAGKNSTELVRQTRGNLDAHTSAWVIASDVFLGTDIFGQYLLKKSLKDTGARKRSLNQIFTKNFKNVLVNIPQILKIDADVIFDYDPAKMIDLCVEKKIRYAIISLVVNACDYKTKKKKTKITIRSNEKWLIVKNDYAKPKIELAILREKVYQDINDLKKKFDLRGIGLFSLHKYFLENFNANIIINYSEIDSEFKVQLPLNLY